MVEAGSEGVAERDMGAVTNGDTEPARLCACLGSLSDGCLGQSSQWGGAPPQSHNLQAEPHKHPAVDRMIVSCGVRLYSAFLTLSDDGVG